jgi:type IV secretion system protein TrbE
MFLRREERRDVKGLSDLLDHFALVRDGVVLTSTGLYVAGWEFSGPDMDGLGPDECWQMAKRLSRKLQFTSGWTMQCDLIRSEHPEYLRDERVWPDPVSYLIEQERRARFLIGGEAAPRLSRYFMVLSYEPALKGAKGAARWIFSGDEQGRDGPAEKALAYFNGGLRRSRASCAAICRACAG